MIAADRQLGDAGPRRVLPLAELAACLDGVDPAAAAAIAERLAADQPGDLPVSQRTSGLNYDRSPLQLCITIRRGRTSARLLADPAAGEPDPARRFARSRAALATALREAGAAALGPLCERMLATHVGAPAAHPDGMLWLAAGLGEPGAAVYVDARGGGGEAAHRRLSSWLRDECGTTPAVEELVAALAHPAVRLQSLGVEGLDERLARLKVYWRLTSPRQLADVGLARFADPRIAQFATDALAGHAAMQLTGIVLSAGIAIADGQSSDVKLDLCGCPRCLHRPPAAWGELIERVAERNRLAPPPLGPLLAASEVAFVGFGIGADDEPRFNLYVKAPPGAGGEPG